MSLFLSVASLLMSLAAIAMSIDSIRLMRRAERTLARTQKLRDARAGAPYIASDEEDILHKTPEQYAAWVDRLVNDPERIERRKAIAPALIVKRRREDPQADCG